jgi:hypothetical protein
MARSTKNLVAALAALLVLQHAAPARAARGSAAAERPRQGQAIARPAGFTPLSAPGGASAPSGLDFTPGTCSGEHAAAATGGSAPQAGGRAHR